MVRTSTRSGGVHQPSSVSLLVSRSIANVKKCFKAEHAKAKRAQVSAKRTEEEQKRQQRYVEKCAKLRRLDAEVIEKLLERGKCTMRFKMRGAHQLVRNDWASLEDKRESMRGTSWVFCKACDDYGTDAWHNPSKLLSPEELLGGHRHQPCCTHNGARWEGGRVSLTCPELRRVPRKLPRPEYWGSACDVSLVVSPPPPPEVPDLHRSSALGYASAASALHSRVYSACSAEAAASEAFGLSVGGCIRAWRYFGPHPVRFGG